MKADSIFLICLDLWGTLIEGGGRPQIQDLKKILGAKIPDDVFLKQTEDALLTQTVSLKRGIKNLMRKLSLPPNENIVNQAYDSWWSYVEKSKAFPETEAVLEKLKNSGRDLFIVSNTDIESINYKLKALGWQKYFKKYFLSANLGLLKPDQRVFQAVQQPLSTPKKNILMVDDSLYHGVIPARRFGWQAVWVARGKPGKDKNKISSLTKLFNYL